MAKQLIADLYECDVHILDSIEDIKIIARQSVKAIGASIVEESIHKFDPIGISYYAIISTSHFSIHTWPEFGYAAIDVFSCNDLVTEQLLTQLKSSFKTHDCTSQIIERRIRQ